MLIGDALWRLCLGLEHTGDLSRGLVLAEECLAVAQDIAIPLHELQARFMLGTILDELGDHGRARTG